MTPKPETRTPAGVSELPWTMVVASWLAVGLFHVLRWIPADWMYGRASEWIGIRLRGHLKKPVLDHASQILGGFAGPEETKFAPSGGSLFLTPSPKLREFYA